jgi:hypothetical protein
LGVFEGMMLWQDTIVGKRCTRPLSVWLSEFHLAFAVGRRNTVRTQSDLF